ncbi:MAG: glycoside hydrolase family 5 protein [Lachnospiraceae bacterium]|nr:glycoside hydrolase family 5 protein [Lachnospiraceae bacterium]
MTRKIAAILMVIILMALPVAGCRKGGSGADDKAVVTPQPDQTVVNTDPSANGGSENGTGISSDETAPEVTAEPLENGGFRKAVEIVAAINVGWNLGNTLESVGAGNTLSSETYWSNPKTTQEMIDAVAAQGFNAIRIPVTWAEHLGPAPDYKIDEKWMNRVNEVVDYAMKNNMCVMINTHHETEYWLKMDQDVDVLCAELSAIWKQVAEHFKDYPDNLIFEGMNEPRTKGSPQEWNGGTYDERKKINAMNAAFIDAVRSTGGNNAYRSLVICTYGHSAATPAISALEVPEDDPNIIVAVHAYTPYFFTYDAAGGYSEWTGEHVSDIKSFATVLSQHYTMAGIPVIISEFGSVNKKNTADVIAWITDYMGIMNKYGIKCFWWDNGQYTSNGENFGIFNRRKLEWFNKDIADALISNSVSE